MWTSLHVLRYKLFANNFMLNFFHRELFYTSYDTNFLQTTLCKIFPFWTSLYVLRYELYENNFMLNFSIVNFCVSANLVLMNISHTYFIPSELLQLNLSVRKFEYELLRVGTLFFWRAFNFTILFHYELKTGRTLYPKSVILTYF